MALLVRVAETLARIVRDWPRARRLEAFYGTSPPTPEELEHA